MIVSDGDGMVTVQLTCEHASALGDLYERACRLQIGFADEHKVTMARLLKLAMKPGTIERLLEGIEAALSVHGLSDDEAGVLDSIRAYLRTELARKQIAHLRLTNRAMAAARADRDELVVEGMPPSALPDFENGGSFVECAARVIAAIREYFRGTASGDRLDPWCARIGELARGTCDVLATEEAAQLVSLACRWASDCFKRDAQTGMTTLTGHDESPSCPRLTTVHLEGALTLDRICYQASLVGDLAFVQDWLTRYPYAVHVVATASLERVLGYLTALPMTPEAIVGTLQNGNDARIPLDRIATCTRDERVQVYIPSVVIRADCDRIKVKNELRRSFARGLRWLRQRGVEIEAVVAVGYSDGGRSLLREHDFRIASELEARVGAGSALLTEGRHLYEMVKAHRPDSVLGLMLHDAAFGP
jgi:hypothetical protein